MVEIAAASGWVPERLREAMERIVADEAPGPDPQRALRLLFLAYQEAQKRRAPARPSGV